MLNVKDRSEYEGTGLKVSLQVQIIKRVSSFSDLLE